MRDAVHRYGSVQRLIPLSSSVNTKIAPLWMMLRFSASWNRRVTRGTIPARVASSTSIASRAVLIHPRSMSGLRGGGVPGADDGGDGDGDAGCVCVCTIAGVGLESGSEGEGGRGMRDADYGV